jgi:enoyl-CoA hydratase/carnithine racemase
LAGKKLIMIQSSLLQTSDGRTAAPGLAPSSDRLAAIELHDAQPQNIHMAVREDGLCILTFDRPNSPANIFDRATLTELGKELAFIARDSQIKGLILRSAKPSIFIAGADLKSMSEASPGEIRELIELGQNVMNRLTALPIPTIAAIHGAALGGGFELCLACYYRVASNDRATKIGLPETQLGLLPAWGGATRLPRLIGLPKALALILAGKTLPAKQALKRGLVDEVVPEEYVLDVAIRALTKANPKRHKHYLVNNAMAASVIASRVRAQLLRKTRGHYPAVLKALDVMTRGISKSIPESLALEREGILELVQTDACRNLIRLFFLQERAKKKTVPDTLCLSPSNGEASKSVSSPVSRAAVIGAGVMGAGIAQWLSAKNLKVIIRDINPEQVSRQECQCQSLSGRRKAPRVHSERGAGWHGSHFAGSHGSAAPSHRSHHRSRGRKAGTEKEDLRIAGQTRWGQHDPGDEHLCAPDLRIGRRNAPAGACPWTAFFQSGASHAIGGNRRDSANLSRGPPTRAQIRATDRKTACGGQGQSGLSRESHPRALSPRGGKSLRVGRKHH